MDHDMKVENIEPSTPVVEGDKMSKKSIIGMTILTVVALAGVAFGIWGISEKNRAENDLAVKITEATGKVTDFVTDKITSVSEDGTVTEIMDAVAGNDDNWENFVKNMSGVPVHVSASYDDGNVTHWLSAIVSDNYLKIEDSKSNDANKTPLVILEEDDVLAVYYLEIGNGGVPYFYIIKTDGDVYRFGLYEDNRTLEKVGDYSKIVSAFVGNGLVPTLIDINGNIYETSY